MSMSGGQGQMGMPVMGGHAQIGQSPLMGQTGMGPGGPQMQVHPGHLIHHPPAQHMQMNPQDQPRLDNISKAKCLMPNLQESLRTVLKLAAQAVNANSMVDSGSKSVELDPSRFDKSLEEFFSVCDQLEMQLKTSIECIGQGMSSGRYLSTPVSATKTDSTVSYPQYITTVRNQIAYTKSLHDILTEASQKVTE